VELVLPGTYYLVRMLDGRIDTQGTVEYLRAQGVLDDITQDESIQVQKEDQVAVSDAHLGPEAEVDADDKPTEDIKKPRQLVKDEAREHGAVKWSIYNTYLEASFVFISSLEIFCLMPLQIVLDMGHFELTDRDHSGLGCRRETLDQTMGPGLWRRY